MLTNLFNFIHKCICKFNGKERVQKSHPGHFSREDDYKYLLAEQLGLSKMTISRWCTNTTQPSAPQLIEISSRYSISALRNSYGKEDLMNIALSRRETPSRSPIFQAKCLKEGELIFASFVEWIGWQSLTRFSAMHSIFRNSVLIFSFERYLEVFSTTYSRIAIMMPLFRFTSFSCSSTRMQPSKC